MENLEKLAKLRAEKMLEIQSRLWLSLFLLPGKGNYSAFQNHHTEIKLCKKNNLRNDYTSVTFHKLLLI